MQWRKRLIAGLLVVFVAIVAGCGNILTVETKYGQGVLESFANKLMSLKVYEQYGLVPITSGARENAVHLQVRKKADFDKPMTEAEIEEIKEAIFKEIGSRVPLELEVFTLGEVPHIIGKLTAVDQNGSLLIVEDQEASGQDDGYLQAIWFGISQDTVILKDGERINVGDLKVGYEVKGWHSAIVMESYPEQAEGLKIEVTGPGTSETGELSGTVEKVSFGHADWMQNFVVVDGKKYRLTDFTSVLAGREKMPVAELKAGDRVLLWFSGYHAFGMENEPKLVTQIAIVQ